LLRLFKINFGTMESETPPPPPGIQEALVFYH
jgi:hypothetical protein